LGKPHILQKIVVVIIFTVATLVNTGN